MSLRVPPSASKYEEMMRLQKDPEVVVGNHKRPTFILGFITLGMVPIEWCVTLMRLQCPMNCNMESLLVKGMEVGVARNYLAEYALKLKNRPEYILMIGDDMLPSWNSLIMLYEEIVHREYDVLAGLYYMKTDQYSIPMTVMAHDNIKGYMMPGIHFRIGEVVETHLVGMDFTLIRTDILEHLGPPPWFESANSKNMLDEKNQGIKLFTEDAFFCHLVKKNGFRIGVHTGVRIGHMTKFGEVY